MKKPNTNEEAWALFSKVIIAQIIIDLIGFFSGWFTDYSTFLFPFQIPLLIAVYVVLAWFFTDLIDNP